MDVSESLTTPSTDLPNYTNPLNLVVAVIFLVIGVFGVVCNSFIVFIFVKEKSERNSFNLICVFRSLSNIYILMTTFLGLFLPKTLSGYSPYSPTVECWLIHLSNTLYMGNEYQIILVAVNRFIAIFFPFYYEKILGITTTFLILLGIYLFRVVLVIFETTEQIHNQCFTYFSVEALAWTYDPQIMCKKEDNILTVLTITFLTMTAINGSTLVKVILFYKSGNAMLSSTVQKRIRRNIILFFQTGLQDSLYLIDLSFMLKLSQLSDSRIWSYISGTFVWQCLHSFDGFIMIMFNERLSLFKKVFVSPSISKVHPQKMTISAVSKLPDVQ